MNLENLILHARILITDKDNIEYIRGISELIASVFPSEGNDTEERAIEIENQITQVEETQEASIVHPLGNESNTEHQEYFPGATVQEIGEVMMQDVVGEYDTPDQIPEWAWVQNNASFNHCKNGDSGVWEFVINLGKILIDIPERLRPVIAEARQKDLVYLIFNQGT